MATYQSYLTSVTSGYANPIEPSGGDTGNTYMRVGNNDAGIAHFILLKLPSNLPTGAVVSSATLRLTEYDSEYRGAGDLAVKIGRVTGAWTTATKFNALPACDTVTVNTFTFNSSNNPDSSHYTGRTYHPTQYKYSQNRWQHEELVFVQYVYYNEYNEPSFSEGIYLYNYVSTIAAYYDDYWVWHDIDVTAAIRDCIAKGTTGLILWFDLPGSNDTRKYFRSPLSSSTDDQPLLTIEYGSIPIKAASAQGMPDKQAVALKAALTEGPVNKTVVAMKAALAQGPFNKTVL